MHRSGENCRRFAYSEKTTNLWFVVLKPFESSAWGFGKLPCKYKGSAWMEAFKNLKACTHAIVVSHVCGL